ncbi:hypothetical protein Syun_006415 [Stephania yunnanensis]|uniref:Uncharacterized protein n=1 Tax=Stephania yunnanensis TaxID=152371 RepID=A0AAP0PZA2_9MAGN
MKSPARPRVKFLNDLSFTAHLLFTPNSTSSAASASSGFFRSLGDLGLGYPIAIALGLLISSPTFSSSPTSAAAPSSDGIVLPHVIFLNSFSSFLGDQQPFSQLLLVATGVSSH